MYMSSSRRAVSSYVTVMHVRLLSLLRRGRTLLALQDHRYRRSGGGGITLHAYTVKEFFPDGLCDPVNTYYTCACIDTSRPSGKNSTTVNACNVR